jgi:hypothetical protein
VRHGAIVTAVAGCLLCTAAAACQGGPAIAGHRPAAAPAAGSHRQELPRPLYGVTVDDVARATTIAASFRQLPRKPAARIYFDVTEPASYYQGAVTRLHPDAYLLGEPLDSSDETSISLARYKQRVSSYLAALGSQIDLWEIGNEVNGNWTGPYPKVSAKLTAAYQEVAARGGHTALTLYYNAGCGDGPGELGPLAFSRQYVPAAVRAGLQYVFISYYEADCRRIRPSAATWTAFFRDLHALYPDARLGFGEIGLHDAVTSRTVTAAKSLISYYYALRVPLPYYVGGYFWWFFAEDCVPAGTSRLWQACRSGFLAEAAAFGARPQP